MRQLVKRAKQTLRRLKESIIQQCPPELYACEVCDELDCDNERWQTCQHRLKVAAEVRASELQLNRAPDNSLDAKPSGVDSSPDDGISRSG